MNKPKYFLYARKSTEDDDKQIMSIEAQLFELREFARKENFWFLLPRPQGADEARRLVRFLFKIGSSKAE